VKLKIVSLALGLMVSILVVTHPGKALAQNGGDGLASSSSTAGDGPLRPRNPGLPDDPQSVTVTHTEATRLGRLRRHSGVVAAAATDQQAIMSSQSMANMLSLDCKVEHATLRGLNAEAQNVYEVGCLEGPGYIISATTPRPQAADCVAISGRAARTQAANPGAPAGLTCTLPVNQNVLAVVAAYGRAAGVDCSIDQASWVGESTSGNSVYEIGCAGSGGYWVERIGGIWSATDCVKVHAQNASCSFTTGAERSAMLRQWLASTSASGCDVVDARYMGENANGAYYEVRCGSGGGYVARLDSSRNVRQVLTCAEATTLGGGCRLAPGL
jgi:hypothetical protein